MSTIVHTFQQEAFVAGLSWSVLRTDGDEQTPRQDNKKIRRQAALLTASSYCQQIANQAVYLGLYSAGLLHKRQSYKKLYSLALAFLAAFEPLQQKTLNAILLMPLDQDEARKVLVVIEAGQVVHDKVERLADAHQIIEKYRQQVGMNFHIFSHDGLLAQSKSVTWLDLQQHCQKFNQLKPLPKNKWAISVGVVALCLAAFGIFYFQIVWQAQKKQATLMQQNQLNNHTPRYLQLLEKNLLKVAWTHTQLEQLFNTLNQESSYLNGWALSKIDCDFALHECRYQYERVGGETKNLVQWAQLHQKNYSVLASHQDQLVLVEKMNNSSAALQLFADQLPNQTTANIELNSVFQRLLNAQLQVSTGQAMVWPQQEIDLAKVDAAAKVLQTPVEIKMPWVLRQSTLELLPPYIAWRQLTLQVSHDSHNSQQLILTLKGHHYVQALL